MSESKNISANNDKWGGYVILIWMDFDWISDIDECNDASLNQCTFPNLCVNVDGSYNCSCPDYHVLENDGRTCKG